MALKVTTNFTNKDTVKVTVYIYNDSDALVDPTGSVKISIYDPDEVASIEDEDMSKVTTGTYEYYFHKGAPATPLDSGKWRGVIAVTDGTGDDAVISEQGFSFKVVSTQYVAPEA